MGVWTPGPGPTEGDDTFIGDAGPSSGGYDDVNGLGGNDLLDGGYASDTLNGGLGDDTLLGGEGSDHLISGGGRDVLDGGDDFDTGGLDYSSETLGITLVINDPDQLTQITRGGLPYGSIQRVEVIGFIGGSGDDHVQVVAGAPYTPNTLHGGAGNDTLIGSAGLDYLNGGAGNDYMTGGNDADVFVFATGAGADTVHSFDADAAGGQDLIRITGYGISSADFASGVVITDQGANTLVTIDGINTILLTGVNGDGANVITQADFILGS